MARLGSTETLDETYELTVLLERVDTLKGSASTRGSRTRRQILGTCCIIGLNRGDETSHVQRACFTSHLGERVFDILWVPFSDHRVLI